MTMKRRDFVINHLAAVALAAGLGSLTGTGARAEEGSALGSRPAGSTRTDLKMTESPLFKLSPPASFGIRVRNLDAAIGIYSFILGAAPFQITVFEPDKHWYRGKPCPIRLRIASFQIRPDFKMDLVEDLEDGPLRRRLEEKGEGIDYMAFRVDDYGLALAHMREHGFEVLQNVETMLNVKIADNKPPVNGLLRAAYMESDKLDHLLVEIAHLEQG